MEMIDCWVDGNPRTGAVVGLAVQFTVKGKISALWHVAGEAAGALALCSGKPEKTVREP
jgi:hypothetical protein